MRHMVTDGICLEHIEIEMEECFRTSKEFIVNNVSRNDIILWKVTIDICT